MAYDHATKAGNWGDLHKHAILSALVADYALGAIVVDAHAGLQPAYIVNGADPRAENILKLKEAYDRPHPAHLNTWLQNIVKVGTGVSYPGSPIVLSEASCATVYTNDLYAPPHSDNGFNDSCMPARKLIMEWPEDLVPSFIFLDPSYDDAEQDYKDLGEIVAYTIDRWPDACIAAWMPIDPTNPMHTNKVPVDIQSAGVRFYVTGLKLPGPKASTMFIANPTAEAPKRLRSTIDFLADVLGGEGVVLSTYCTKK